MVGLLVALLVAVIAGGTVVVLAGNDEPPDREGSGTGATGTGSKVDGPTGITGTSGTTGTAGNDAQPPAVVVGHFNAKRGYSKGERLKFGASWLSQEDDCRNHGFANGDIVRIAYYSDCRSWEDNGYDVLMFNVSFENTSDGVVTLTLRNHVLESRDGRTFRPVNLGSKAEFPTNFLDEKLKLPPGAEWRGIVMFDGRVQGMVPESISYIDAGQTLKQEFLGKHSVVE